MKVEFGLGWIKSGKGWQKNFKSQAALSLFEDYLQRLSHFSNISAGKIPENTELKSKTVWICDTSKPAKTLTSEELAKKLSQLLNSGTRELRILIGGPDGFTSDFITRIQPELRWSFGPLTFPHELAAVVAAEQLYRAWTILHHLPYHSGH